MIEPEFATYENAQLARKKIWKYVENISLGNSGPIQADDDWYEFEQANLTIKEVLENQQKEIDKLKKPNITNKKLEYLDICESGIIFENEGQVINDFTNLAIDEYGEIYIVFDWNKSPIPRGTPDFELSVFDPRYDENNDNRIDMVSQRIELWLDAI